MDKKIPWEKLARYFAGECTGEEEQKMKRWIAADPEREEQIDRLYRIWKESGKIPYSLDPDEAWNKLAGNMDDVDNEIRRTGVYHSTAGNHAKEKGRLYAFKKPDRRAGRLARRITVAAASIALVLTVGLFSYYADRNPDESTAEERRVFVTGFGERASYVLSDGSRITLHAGSRLEVPGDYNSENRELYLEGEAFFETAHNPDKPFIVHADEAYTKVVGTEFLVQAWPEEEPGEERGIDVVVAEGKVMFGAKDAGTIHEVNRALLSKNQRGHLGSNKEVEVSEVFDMHWYLGWTEGRLVFENRPLREVLPRLERWFDIRITVADQTIQSQKITAEIDYSLPMSDVLQGIALTLDLEVEKEGRSVTFR